ncbi:hypothetical protein ACRYCC_04065 [Actinomadura scrupuli]|uniref:hypothetical protein n=1 Tax=Actinomadura scrupuli TaxID=559629 RepID=UPI003D971EBA
MRLPLDALRLAIRFLVPLTIWYGAGRIIRHLLLLAISHVGHGRFPAERRVLALLLLSLVVLVSLAVTIGMLLTLARGLRRAPLEQPLREESYRAAVFRSLLPFVIVYLAWNLFQADAHDALRFDAQRLGDQGNALEAGSVFIGIPLTLALAIMIVAWSLRMVCERWHWRSPGRVSASLVAFFEVNFTLYGVLSIGVVAASIGSWIGDRNLWQDLAEVPGLAFAGSLVPPVKDALVLPIIWFAMTAVVYGVELRGRDVVTGTRLEALHERFSGVGGADRPADRAGREVGRGFRDKYVPLLHAGRLAFAAGGPAAALFCLCYVAIGIGMDAAQRTAAALIGPAHTVQFWNVALVPLEFGHGLLAEVLRLALLAAMFDLVISARTPASDPLPAG